MTSMTTKARMMTMGLLAKTKRAKHFKYLGLGDYNSANVLKFQRIAFTDPNEWDGKYGKKTDAALRHWVNVRKCCTTFEPQEFKCGCGGKYCTGYPTWMRSKELRHVQRRRDHYGKPMRITSALRCSKFNASLKGSSKTSRHMDGYAVDFVISGVTDTLAQRISTIRYIEKLPYHDYSYGNGYSSTGAHVDAPNMGNALHTQTK